MAGGLGQQRVIGNADNPAFHDRQSSLLPDATSFQAQGCTDSDLLPVAYFSFRRKAVGAFDEPPVGHHIIEQRKHDATMRDTGVTHVTFIGRELANADIVFKSEMRVQTNRILLATHKTVMGVAACRNG